MDINRLPRPAPFSHDGNKEGGKAVQGHAHTDARSHTLAHTKNTGRVSELSSERVRRVGKDRGKRLPVFITKRMANN